ncbi:hypothetical protein TRFO_04763 [Tritrichomonas foetus]|uniref:ATPase AAA-type core domain-containing protein n=1 Tax=Tritrichomonas foetus TaxID=1144522 RepID=A0A1J4KH74_9EUKA|nr:hypothetical protein TRFO_04763 [Tritrichomonas foetus]|eukprot:OHT08693.1 hypothetical protein TRFO_04763 [Tritrichomonas foetus]
MPQIVYFPVLGKILSGKSELIRKLIDIFIQHDEIQVSGYTQPSHFEEGDRNGYDLILIQNDNTLQTYEFARLKPRTRPGQIPYQFEETVFEEVYKVADTIEYKGKHVLLIFDEIGRLEINGKGHHRAILRFLETFKNSPKIHLVVTFNERRHDEVKAFLDSLNAVEAELKIESTDIENDIQKISESILNAIKL